MENKEPTGLVTHIHVDNSSPGKGMVHEMARIDVDVAHLFRLAGLSGCLGHPPEDEHAVVDAANGNHDVILDVGEEADVVFKVVEGEQDPPLPGGRDEGEREDGDRPLIGPHEVVDRDVPRDDIELAGSRQVAFEFGLLAPLGALLIKKVFDQGALGRHFFGQVATRFGDETQPLGSLGP